MIKISVVDAYQGMNEIDFSVMDDELHLCFDSDQRGDRKQSRQFYLDNKNNIILEIYWDDEKVHTVAFENKAELTDRGKMRLAEAEIDATEIKQVLKQLTSKGENIGMKNLTFEVAINLNEPVGLVSGQVSVRDTENIFNYIKPIEAENHAAFMYEAETFKSQVLGIALAERKRAEQQKSPTRCNAKDYLL